MTRHPEQGNMEGKQIRYSVREQEIHLNKSTKNAASYLSTIAIRVDLHGRLTATQERVFYNATPDNKGRATHIRDSSEGIRLLSEVTPQTIPAGESGKYNPYSKQAMKPPLQSILDMLEEI